MGHEQGENIGSVTLTGVRWNAGVRFRTWGISPPISKIAKVMSDFPTKVQYAKERRKLGTENRRQHDGDSENGVERTILTTLLVSGGSDLTQEFPEGTK